MYPEVPFVFTTFIAYQRGSGQAKHVFNAFRKFLYLLFAIIAIDMLSALWHKTSVVIDAVLMIMLIGGAGIIYLGMMRRTDTAYDRMLADSEGKKLLEEGDKWKEIHDEMEKTHWATINQPRTILRWATRYNIPGAMNGYLEASNLMFETEVYMIEEHDKMGRDLQRRQQACLDQIRKDHNLPARDTLAPA